MLLCFTVAHSNQLNFILLTAMFVYLHLKIFNAMGKWGPSQEFSLTSFEPVILRIAGMCVEFKRDIMLRTSAFGLHFPSPLTYIP